MTVPNEEFMNFNLFFVYVKKKINYSSVLKFTNNLKIKNFIIKWKFPLRSPSFCSPHLSNPSNFKFRLPPGKYPEMFHQQKSFFSSALKKEVNLLNRDKIKGILEELHKTLTPILKFF